MSALGARMALTVGDGDTADRKFTFHGKQIKDPYDQHFADARGALEAEAIVAALNAPIFFGQWTRQQEQGR